MLLNAPYPSDIRVKKEADALIGENFEVHLLCLRKKNQAYSEEFEGIKIHRIDAGRSNQQLAFWDVIMSVSFIHPKFRSAMKDIATKDGIKVVHIHDLPLAGTALSLKSKLGLKVVVDLHENYPEALRTWFKWKKNPVVRLKNILFMNPARWSKLEGKACVQADRIIAVVTEMKERIMHEHQIASSKITIVTNTEDRHFLEQKSDSDIYQDLKGKFVITYSGGIGPHRGVDVAIKGMQFLRDEKDIQLAIVGFGSPSVMKSLENLVHELKLDNVHFLGFQPFSKFYSYMRFASANVIPHQSNGHTDNTVPHKLFQGMMAGRPLIVSSSVPLKRIVEEHKSGLVFSAGDPKDFALKVKQLHSDPQLCSTLAENGLKATVHGELVWEKTSKELINLYQSFFH